MMTLSEASELVGGCLHGEGALFESVSIDSRTLRPGELFVAIEGEYSNGHDFVASSAESGAAGAMVMTLQPAPIPQIRVDDTTRSLGVLARSWRERFTLPVVAITGSNGKTTVARLVASILSRMGKCLSPQKSFNNRWGVPLTLLGLRDTHRYAVIEMGTSGPGEIRYLSSLARPTIAIINNVSPAHVAGLGGVEQISKAKSEIFSGMEEGGTAIINLDDRFHDDWRGCFRSQVGQGAILTFGSSPEADVGHENPVVGWSGSEFDLRIGQDRTHVTLPLPGLHNVSNATASAAIAHAAGADLESVREGLESVVGAPGRLRRIAGINGAEVVDDSYNANPRSIMAAIDVLAGFQGRKILVLGEMAELGVSGPEHHREVGTYARKRRIDALYCLGREHSELSGYYAEGFGQGSGESPDAESLISRLRCDMDANTAVLVKGSRSSRMERIVAGIADEARNRVDSPC